MVTMLCHLDPVVFSPPPPFFIFFFYALSVLGPLDERSFGALYVLGFLKNLHLFVYMIYLSILSYIFTLLLVFSPFVLGT